ncbi:IS1096 element passenger TnpR family protein [Streptomyces chartreusis]|uniref:IS1096 element passenger TnpR family protein n=1 Tax=Streptomyces chartreusis TaxID=1969 RepID=UPI00381E3043
MPVRILSEAANSDEASADTVAPVEDVHQLRVSIPDIEPEVWRRIHVYSQTPLSGLHAVIQVAMGWDDAPEKSISRVP